MKIYCKCGEECLIRKKPWKVGYEIFATCPKYRWWWPFHSYNYLAAQGMTDENLIT